jgi:hypothetical protein
MDNSIDANQILNDVLSIVCKGGESYRKFIFSFEIKSACERQGYTFDARFLDFVLEKLKSDGLISDDMEKYGKGVQYSTYSMSETSPLPITNTVEFEKVGREQIWIALFNGIVFNQNGGYLEVKRVSDEKTVEEKMYRQRAENAANRLNYLTAILGVATAALAVSEGMKIYTK